MLMLSLFLDRADHDPFHEIPLQERINEQDRQCADKNLRGLDRPLRQVGEQFGIDLRHVRLNDDRLHETGERQLLRILHINHTVEIRVPMADHDEQGDRCDGRQRNRQVDHEERSELPGSVDKSGFLQLLRHGTEKVEHQNDIVYAYQSRQDQRHHRIHQSELKNQDIARYESAAEQHRDDKIPEIQVTRPEDASILR